MPVPQVAGIGIDAGKLSHHATAVDAEGTVLWSQQVTNDQTAIQTLIAKATASASEVRWAVDLPSAYAALLLALLVAAGQPVVYVPGTMVNRMSGAFAGEGKTDPRDAKVIAETARLRRDLTQITTPDELVVELSLLVGHRADLMADWVRGVNRLRDLLTRVFPALERAFDYSNRARPILLPGYCTPVSIRQAGPQGLSEYLHEQRAHRVSIPGIVTKALAAARAQTVVLPGESTYQRKRAERQRHTTAMIALARRLVDVLWALLRDSRVWQPTTPTTAPTT